MTSPQRHPLSPSQAPPSAAPQPQCNACNHGNMHTHAHMHACQSTGPGFKLNHARPAAARPGRGSGQTTHMCTWQCILALHVCPTMLASACTLGHAHGAGPPPHQGQCTCPAPQALRLATAGRMLAVGLRRMAGQPTYLTTPRHTSHSHPIPA